MDPPSNYLFGKVAHVPACFFFFNSFQFFLLLLSLQLLIQSSKILLNFFINLSFKLFLNDLLIHFFKIISNSFINKFLLDLLLSFANFDSKLDFVLSDEMGDGSVQKAEFKSRRKASGEPSTKSTEYPEKAGASGTTTRAGNTAS